ncbi:MAG: alkaline phosphatase family protein [Deltaproteobacteria bacterium]|nr:alkaline phosphatase family protein [Deltaproteobacteria bacterium]
MSFRRCLMILADGARADVFQDLLKKGRLPNIAEHLPHFRTGVSAFPSTTGPAYMPYLTGCFPGTCNVPGIRWFDKEAYSRRPFATHKFRSYVGAETFFIPRDMSHEVDTLFELIPRSFNIFNSVSRGVKRRFNRTWFSRIWYWYYAHLTDHWSLVDRVAARKMVHEMEKSPEFLFVVFPGIDEHSHLASPFHPDALKSYELIDEAIGTLHKKLKSLNQWEEAAIFIVSDHGLSETKTHLGLNQFLEGLGISTFYYPKVVFRYRFKAASMVSGNGMSHLYLKGTDGWKGRMLWDEIENRKDRLLNKLLERPEIDVIAGQVAEGVIRVRSRRGEAIVHVGAPLAAPKSGARQGAPLQYQIVGTDPFGYPPLPATMSERDSLHLTANTEYPDALMQLLQIFRSRRTGDLVLSATRGFDLRKRHEVPEHKSTHGSLHWEHMNIPIVSNIPLTGPSVRSVDLFPTVLKLLGRPCPSGLDGIEVLAE